MASAVQKIAALHDQIDSLFIPERADAMQAMSQHLYGQGGPEGGSAGPSGGPRSAGPNGGDGKSGKDEVIDAEFEVKK